INVTHGTVLGVTTIDSFIDLAANTTVQVTSSRATLNLNGGFDLLDHILTISNVGTVNLNGTIDNQQGHSCPAIGFIKEGTGLLNITVTNGVCGPGIVRDGTLRVLGALPATSVVVSNIGVLE